jgi:hypothetical protein
MRDGGRQLRRLGFAAALLLAALASARGETQSHQGDGALDMLTNYILPSVHDNNAR